jgi:hypothetical protein
MLLFAFAFPCAFSYCFGATAMAKRCYVLGAGFSKPFGFPLSSELTKAVFDNIEKGCSSKMLRTAWLSQIKGYYPACDFDMKWPDIEQLATVLNESEKYRLGVEAGREDTDFRGIANLLRCLPKELDHTMRLRHVSLNKEVEAQRLSVEWANLLAFVKFAVEAQSAVVSFNWDLLLEVACHKLGLAVSYGGTPEEGALRLAKPHGSINMIQSNNQHFGLFKDVSILELAPESDSPDAPLIMRPANPDPTPCLLPADSLIVLPEVRKDYEHKWIKGQWVRALKMVRDADEIVVVGYSLPPHDYRPRILLQVAGFQRVPRHAFWVVVPEPLVVENRYHEFIPQAKAISSSWVDWFASTGGACFE